MQNFKDFRIFPDLRIILEYYSGKTNLINLIENKKRLTQDSRYNPDYNIISDFRKAVLDLNEDDIIEFIEFLRLNKMIPDFHRESILMPNDPHQLIFLSLYVFHLKDLSKRVNFCSTVKGALEWFGILDDELLLRFAVLKNNREPSENVNTNILKEEQRIE